MARLRKLLYLIIALVVLYLLLHYLGFFGGALEQVRSLDQEFRIGEDRLIPGERSELDEYEAGLRRIQPANEQEGELIALKLELVGMQREFLSLAENSKRINFSEPDCRPSGSVKLTEAASENALAHAERALAKKDSVRGVTGFSHITNSTFEETVGAAIESLEATVVALKNIC